ncbi:DUF4283 domain protein, partial [Trifolium medium]|nr:DUF4283 domain protein [Trifolium medium]
CLVDDVLVEVKLVEEWGLNIGGDACLFEEETVPQDSEPDHFEEHGDPDHRSNVNELVEKLAHELVNEERE